MKNAIATPQTPIAKPPSGYRSSASKEYDGKDRSRSSNSVPEVLYDGAGKGRGKPIMTPAKS